MANRYLYSLSTSVVYVPDNSATGKKIISKKYNMYFTNWEITSVFITLVFVYFNTFVFSIYPCLLAINTIQKNKLKKEEKSMMQQNPGRKSLLEWSFLPLQCLLSRSSKQVSNNGAKIILNNFGEGKAILSSLFSHL